MTRVAAILLLLIFASVTAVADDESKRLLESIQGDWERNVVRDGTTVRVVKSVEKNRETVSYYIDQRVIYAHQVDFQVLATSQGNVFQIEKMQITVGPDAGKTNDQVGSYLFKIDNDEKWYEVHRMLPGEDGEPWINVYRRVK